MKHDLIDYYEICDDSFNKEENLIKSTKSFTIAEKLARTAYPDKKDEYDLRWESFYLPLKRRKKAIVLPMSIMLYKNEYYVSIEKCGRWKTPART